MSGLWLADVMFVVIKKAFLNITLSNEQPVMTGLSESGKISASANVIQAMKSKSWMVMESLCLAKQSWAPFETPTWRTMTLKSTV